MLTSYMFNENILYLDPDLKEDALFHQIFSYKSFDISGIARYSELQELYASILRDDKKPLIIDVGANIGLSSIYFSSLWSDASILAIEPDSRNFSLLSKNTKHYTNVLPFHNAISNVVERMSISNPSSNPVGFVVQHDEQGEILSITVPELLTKFTDCTPFLIKIDIEGYESNLFSSNTSWVDLFPVMIIEPHDWFIPKSSGFSNFLQIHSTLKRDFIIKGENVISIKNVEK